MSSSFEVLPTVVKDAASTGFGHFLMLIPEPLRNTNLTNITSQIMNGTLLRETQLDPYASISSTEFAIFLFSLTLWTTAYYHTTISPHNPNSHPRGFEHSKFISNLHSIPLVFLSLASLLEFIPETYPIFYSVGFFIVDLADCIKRGDAVFFLHAILTLGLNLGTCSSVVHRGLRSSSKGFLAEASTVGSYKEIRMCLFAEIISAVEF